MNELKKHTLSIAIIAILVFFKFVFMPIIDWQNEQLSTISMNERKIIKIERLIADEFEIIENKKLVESKLTQFKKFTFSHQPADVFQREQQKIIEAEFESSALNIRSIGWKAQLIIADTPITQFQIEYAFSGEAEKVIDYLLRLESKQPWLDLLNLQLSFRKQKAGGLGNLNARIRVGLHMLNAKNEQIKIVGERS